MSEPNFDDLLLQTFDDQQLSRNERQLIRQLLDEQRPDEQKLALYRHQAFALARNQINDGTALKVLDWLEEVVKALQARQQAPTSTFAEAHFSPGTDCPARIAQLIASARRKVDVCVFTITDDRISRPLLAAHQKGVAVRILTDNEKLTEAGSDIESLARAGVPVRVDRTPYHMHHKFALFDDERVLTGSYNWTRGAAEYNHENFVVSNEPRLLKQFGQVFDKLWRDLEPLR
jgi:phosphatidylserine/phosphatidylglycerophosphate/cardiolipin synthase-like enzyme